jgi:hypothetical protein
MQIAVGVLLLVVFGLAASVGMTRASNMRPLTNIALACVVALLFAVVLAAFVVIAMRLING